MPRYMVEREFTEGLRIPVDEIGAKSCLAVVQSNLTDQVTWIHSYVSADRTHVPLFSDVISRGCGDGSLSLRLRAGRR